MLHTNMWLDYVRMRSNKNSSLFVYYILQNLFSL